MWRLRYVLLSLILVPAPLLGQVQVSLLVPGEALSLGAQIQALERSREALLEARHSVETALDEVDRVLLSLRHSIPPCDHPGLVSQGTSWPGPLALARLAPSAAQSLWSAVAAAARSHWGDLNRIKAFAVSVIARQLAADEMPPPVLPRPDTRDPGRPVVATARDLEVLRTTAPGVSPMPPPAPPSGSEPGACLPETQPTRSMEEAELERVQPVIAALDSEAPIPSPDPRSPRLPTIDRQEALSRPADEETQP